MKARTKNESFAAIFKRLGFRDENGGRDEERLRRRLKNISRFRPLKIFGRFIACGGAASGGTEVRSGGVIREELSGSERIAIYGNTAAGYPSRVAALRKAPAFTITTVLTLALGIGATTSIFTLVYAVMLKSLAVANPSELYRLGKEARCCYWGGYSQEEEFSLVSYDLYKYFRDQHERVCGTGGIFGGRAGVRRPALGRLGGSPKLSRRVRFRQLLRYVRHQGVCRTAAYGQDDRPGAAAVAVMSYRLWQQRYGSDPSVIGSVFDIDEKPFTIVGITPPGFFGDSCATIRPISFCPLNTEPFVEADADLNRPNNHWLDVIGRIQSRRESGIYRG